MKKYCVLLLSLVVLSCDNSDDSLDFIAAVESELGVTATNSPLGGEGHFFQSVVYGTAERQELDILLPEGEQFKGVLLFFTEEVLLPEIKAMPSTIIWWKPCKPF